MSKYKIMKSNLESWHKAFGKPSMTIRPIYVIADRLEAADKIASLIRVGYIPDLYKSEAEVLQQLESYGLMQSRYRAWSVTDKARKLGRDK